jgi:hypothetical protein
MNRSCSRKVSRPWTREEMAFMRKYYRNNETSWVARELGRTVYSVRYKAVDLHIRKANPSIWRGNTGSTSATRKSSPRRTTRSAWNRTPQRRSNRRTRNFRAMNTRRMPRRSMPRRTRRNR